MTGTDTGPRYAVASVGKLSVKWFKSWKPDVAEALAQLPEQEACPHELYRLLATAPSRSRRCIAVVSLGPDPVAVLALRKRKGFWEPVTQLVCPGALPPAKPGYLMESLAAAGKHIRLSEWPAAPAQHKSVWLSSWPRSLPVFKADLTSDFEQHWRAQSGFYSRSIKRARQRCANLEFEVNGDGAAEWTVAEWQARWAHDERQQVTVSQEYRVASRFFDEKGGGVTFRLLDGKRPVAGQTYAIRGSSLSGQVMIYDPAYAREMVGTHLLDRVFHWAADNGISEIDLGCGEAYKAKFAPVGGEVWFFDVCPRHIQLLKGSAYTLKNRLSASLFRLRNGLRGSGRGQIPEGEAG